MRLILQMQADELKQHVDMVSELLMYPYLATSTAESLRSILQDVEKGMSKYYAFLKRQQETSARNHKSPSPVRSRLDNWMCKTIEAASSTDIQEQYKALSDMLTAAEMYQPCPLLDVTPVDRYSRRKWIDQIRLPFPIMTYTYCHGNYLGNMVFAWRVPEEDRSDDSKIQAVQAIQPLLPVYSTREMRRDFMMRYAKCTKMKPAVMRNMYQYLTNDESSGDTAGEDAVQQRLFTFLLESDDVELVHDLRKNNGRHKDPKLDPFWEELGRFLQEKGAVQERRHNEYLYMPCAISVSDLLEQVKARLPENTPVPSLSWLKLNFFPSNPYTRAAVNYTGRFEVKRTVQQRLLRAQHEDAGYTAHLYSMMKQFAVKQRAHASFIAVDDKTTIPIGKPNQPISTNVRPHNRSLVASSQQVLSAMDHDFHVHGCIPSVLFKITIPEDARDGFSKGDVYVTVKDKVFQPSSPLRHATEDTEILRHAAAADAVNLDNPILFVYSDGGPDHRTNYQSVQLAALALFVALDLDMYIAVRTGPSQSYANPAERIMSLLNLALQNVALCREQMDDAKEYRVKSLNSLKAVRAASSKDPALKQALLESLEPVQQILKERFSRLKRNGEQVCVHSPATEESIQQLAEMLSVIDESLDITNLSSVKMTRHPLLKKFFDTHCHARHYSFQVCLLLLSLTVISRISSENCFLLFFYVLQISRINICFVLFYRSRNVPALIAYIAIC